MENLFFQLTIILIIASALSIVFRLIKQPPILAYLATGLILGPAGILNDSEEIIHSFEQLSEIGITLLLFILGLELKIGELKTVGKVALLGGVGQVTFTSAVGFVIAYILGFSITEAVYIAIALTFSSTIIIVKLLSDKKEINSLYGKITVGILLAQDFFAILSLVVLNGLNADGASNSQALNIGIVFIKMFVVFSIVIFLSSTIIPRIIHYIARSQEILFVFTLAWAFGISWLISSEYIGLSIEIGGFLAGLALANSLESFQIASKVRALRDFFIVLFFVTLGLSLDLSNISEILVPGIYLSLFVLIGNPLIVLIILTLQGFTSRTGFLSGLALAQISEFSLILIILGRELGHVSNDVVSVITFVAITTFGLSSYLILNNERIYNLFKPILKTFEFKRGVESKMSTTRELEDHIVVVGAHRMGISLLENLIDIDEDVLVVDYDPNALDKIKDKFENVLFGDISDSDILEMAMLNKARMVISTVPGLEDNLILINTVKGINPDLKIIVAAEHNEYIKDLRKAGADVVIQPYKLAGQMLSSLVKHSEIEFE